ncbi:MAG: XRE family transcriptional regulator [Candidatus Obscuribacterales bacterium]|nr:XRE family transcriptional regulator [Steroidobacteraceae bacterium]
MKAHNAHRTRLVKAKTGRDLARLLELSEKDSVAMELRVAVVKKIIAEVGKQELTHAQAAERTGTSRSRMTSILNGAIQDVSTDLLLRVLSALGIRATISFAKVA